MNLSIIDCEHCPFEYSDEVSHSCRHPKQPRVEYPAYFPDGAGPERPFVYVDNEFEAHGSPPPWCPLRSEPVTIEFHRLAPHSPKPGKS